MNQSYRIANRKELAKAIRSQQCHFILKFGRTVYRVKASAKDGFADRMMKLHNKYFENDWSIQVDVDSIAFENNLNVRSIAA